MPLESAPNTLSRIKRYKRVSWINEMVIISFHLNSNTKPDNHLVSIRQNIPNPASIQLKHCRSDCTNLTSRSTARQEVAESCSSDMRHSKRPIWISSQRVDRRVGFAIENLRRKGFMLQLIFTSREPIMKSALASIEHITTVLSLSMCFH